MGLIARAIEEAGIPTTSLSSAYDLTALVKPPRSFFVNYPLGHTAGRPFDRENQLAILRNALGRAGEITEPGAIVELPLIWDDPAWQAGVWKSGDTMRHHVPRFQGFHVQANLTTP